MTVRQSLSLFGALALFSSATPAPAQTNLADAVDVTNLVWTTGGTGGIGWIYEAQDPFGGDNSFDGVDSARSGQIGSNGETWMQTTVVGPGTVSFWWNAWSEPDSDFVEFYVGPDLVDRISGVDPVNPVASGWEYRVFPVPAGTNVLKWRYAKDASLTGGTLDCAWVDQVRYVTAPDPALDLALNTCSVAWSSGGNTNITYWFGQTNMTRDGKCAAQSGAIWHNQTNWLQATVTGVSNVSFWWKVSSQTNSDPLEFYTNGVFAKRISGEVGWQSNSFKLPASATNTLRWLYRKDGMFTQGGNCGWLDQVSFSPPFKPGIVSYLTNTVLSTTSSNCQGVLPDLASAGLFLLGPGCGSVTVTQSPPAGTLLPQGITHVVLTAVDPFSGTTATVTNTTTVADLTPPQIVQAVPAQTLAADTNCTARLPDLASLLQATDNCGATPHVVQEPAAGTALPLGITTVTFQVDDGNGNTNSSSTAVMVEDQALPLILAQPASRTNGVGSKEVFTVAAKGCSGLNFAWYFQKTPLSGQTNSSLTIEAVQPCSAGDYFVVISSSGGSVTSAVARLTVLSAPTFIPWGERDAGGAFRLTFGGPVGQTYQVLASEDATMPRASWTVLTNGTFASGPAFFTDVFATNYARRFYSIASP